MVGGEGGRTGPDLSTVGSRLDPDEIATSLTDPDAEVAPRWWTMRIGRADGSTLEGLRMNEDTFTVRIMDHDENLWSFMKSEVRSLEQIKTSTMPATEDLSASELDDLVAYLFSLRRES
jgi:putative heme-binding domain-containing protein